MEGAPLAAVIPVHNGAEYTARCLRSLAQADGDPITVVVVDDGSSDGTAELLAREHPDVIVLPASGDLWWSGATNLGCRHALERGARRLLLLNNDNVEIAPNLVVELERAVAETGGCVGAVVLERLPDGSRRILRAAGSLNWRRRGIELRDTGAAYEPASRLEPADWLPGAALALDASLFTELGGFDERRFPQYRGDIDFTRRAVERGYGCHVDFACWVVNDRTQSGMGFDERLGLRQAARGLFSLRANYNLKETVGFALAHAPARLVPYYLAQFYLRLVWVVLKNVRRRSRARLATSREPA